METEVKKWGWKCFVLGHEAEGKICVDCTRKEDPSFKSNYELARLAGVTLRHHKNAQKRREG